MIEKETEDRYNGFINGMQTAKMIVLSCDNIETALARIDISIKNSKRLHADLKDLIEKGKPKDDRQS